MHSERNRLFTKSFFIILVALLIIFGLIIRSNYNSSTWFTIEGEEYKLVSYPDESKMDSRRYVFESGSGTTLTVDQTKGAYGVLGRKGAETYCSYQVTVLKPGGGRLTYGYEANGGYDWGYYGNYYKSSSFPPFRIIMPDGYIENVNYQTAERWNIRDQVSGEARLVLESILSVQWFQPFAAKLTTTLIIMTVVILFWLGMQWVILPNVLGIGSAKNKAFTYAFLGGGAVAALENNKQFTDDDHPTDR